MKKAALQMNPSKIHGTVREPYLVGRFWVNDANGNIETVIRHDGDGHPYDAMNYGYHVDTYGRKLRNRPYNIQDLADQPGNYAQDIPQMAYQPNGITDPQDANGTINSANNFSYDALGQRTKDEKADIELIEWTASGKMKKVHHTTASGKPDITFGYDAAGNRIMKQVGDPDVDPATGYREHYVLDAQGNIMAIYRSQPEPVPNTSPQQYAASLKVVERPVYGSKRLGSYTRAMQLVGEQTITNYPYTQPMQASLKRYELTDHLGNVATVVTGRLLPMIGLGIQYQAEVVSATLHEPFGLELTGMNWQSDVSRFGFQSQIKDLEMNAIHFKYREYFPSDGVFPSIDPLWAKYPWNSPYAFSENRVIDAIELEGLEKVQLMEKGQAMWDKLSGDVKGAFGKAGDAISDGLAATGDWLNSLTGDGGYTLTSDYATKTNNADRKGDPSGSLDVTAIEARANATFGPEKLSSIKLPAQGEGAIANAVEALSSASGAIQAGVNPAQPSGPGQAQAKPALQVVRDYQVNRTDDTISVASPDGRWNGDRYAPGDTIEIRDLYYKDGTYTGEKSTKKTGR